MQRKDIETLLRRHAPRVRSFIGRMVGNTADADDLTQNAMLKALAHMADYDSRRASFSTWLSHIAYNEAIDHLRRTRRATFVSIDEDLPQEDDHSFDDLRPDRVELLRQAIFTLPPADQQLLHLRYTDGLPLRDIGYILSQKPDYLATRLQRIRQRLRKILENSSSQPKET